MLKTANARRFLIPGLVVAFCAALAACGGMMSRTSGSFDRTLTVNGPVQLDIRSSSGNTRISPGAPGQVRIHADFYARAWSMEGARQRAQQVTEHPPIEQQDNFIRLGSEMRSLLDLSVNYTIEVPPDTSLQGATGSGNFQVAGIRGPARIIAGSGDIDIAGVQQEVKVTAGSGDISIAGVKDNVEVTAGSGSIRIAGSGGEIRMHAGSGDISIAAPGGPVNVTAGSGSVALAGLQYDAHVSTSSGAISLQGTPSNHSYWELQAGSGQVTVDVPGDASFRLYAHSESGGIRTDIPLVAEETSSKHDLRAHIGQGDARIEIRTASGDIHLR